MTLAGSRRRGKAPQRAKTRFALDAANGEHCGSGADADDAGKSNSKFKEANLRIFLLFIWSFLREIASLGEDDGAGR
jgi:hypothetical protein